MTPTITPYADKAARLTELARQLVRNRDELRSAEERASAIRGAVESAESEIAAILTGLGEHQVLVGELLIKAYPGTTRVSVTEPLVLA